MTKEVALIFKHLDFNKFFRNPPLKNKRVRGVIKTMEVTPFNPPYFKGES